MLNSYKFTIAFPLYLLKLSGQEINITLPELDFELENEALPLQLRVNGSQPVLTITWELLFAFGESS